MRTRLFKRYPPNPEGLSAYRQRAQMLHHSPPLSREIYRCDFLGFVDEEERRVGCLLHPSLWGEDLRDVSPYGRKLCAEHLCLSHTYLSEAEKGVVIRVLDDWYLYGLVITDLDFVRESLRILADGIGHAVKPQHLEPTLRDALRRFFSFKEHWPFKDSRPRLGKYWFSEGEYRLDHPWDDPWDRILGCLETAPSLWEEAKVYLKHYMGKLIETFLRILEGKDVV